MNTSKKILVVEDEIHIQRLISMLLERAGFEVTSLASGEEALEHLSKNKIPDAMILDIMMPGIDGMEVLHALRADDKTKDLKVLMLTALAQENMIIQGAKLGIKGYIRKPFHPTEFLGRVEKLFKG